MILPPELREEIIKSCENLPDSTNGRIGWLHERISIVEQALLRAHDDAVSKQPCPCGDNDGMHCSLAGCPYPTPREARASGLPHAERPEIDDDELELARVEYLYAKAELADLEALRAHDEYDKRKATRDECRRRGISVPKRLR